MIKDVIKDIFIAIAIGYLANLACNILKIEFMSTFLKDNLITLLVALLAINATTLAVVLSKMREIIDTGSKPSFDFFKRTKSEMLLSVKEQIVLIILSVLVLSAMSSKKAIEMEGVIDFLEVLSIAIFAYAIMVLYDTAKSVFIIMEFDCHP